MSSKKKDSAGAESNRKTVKKATVVQEASEILKRLQEQQKQSSAAKTRAIPRTKISDLNASTSDSSDSTTLKQLTPKLRPSSKLAPANPTKVASLTSAETTADHAPKSPGKKATPTRRIPTKLASPELDPKFNADLAKVTVSEVSVNPNSASLAESLPQLEQEVKPKATSKSKAKAKASSKSSTKTKTLATQPKVARDDLGEGEGEIVESDSRVQQEQALVLEAEQLSAPQQTKTSTRKKSASTAKIKSEQTKRCKAEDHSAVAANPSPLRPSRSRKTSALESQPEVRLKPTTTPNFSEGEITEAKIAEQLAWSEADLEAQTRQVISQELRLISKELNLSLWQELEIGFEAKGLTKEIANLLLKLAGQLSLSEVLALSSLDYEVINYLQINEVEQQILAFNLLADALQKELYKLQPEELTILNIDQAFAALYEQGHLIAKQRVKGITAVAAVSLNLEQLLRYSVYGEIPAPTEQGANIVKEQQVALPTTVLTPTDSSTAVNTAVNNNVKEIGSVNENVATNLAEASQAELNSVSELDNLDHIPDDILFEFMLGNLDSLDLGNYQSSTPEVAEPSQSSALTNSSSATQAASVSNSLSNSAVSIATPASEPRVVIVNSSNLTANLTSSNPEQSKGLPRITVEEYSVSSPSTLTLVAESNKTADSQPSNPNLAQPRVNSVEQELVNSIFAPDDSSEDPEWAAEFNSLWQSELDSETDEFETDEFSELDLAVNEVASEKDKLANLSAKHKPEAEFAEDLADKFDFGTEYTKELEVETESGTQLETNLDLEPKTEYNPASSRNYIDHEVGTPSAEDSGNLDLAKLPLAVQEEIWQVFASQLELFQRKQENIPSALQVLKQEPVADSATLVQRLFSQLADPNPVKTQLPHFAQLAQFNTSVGLRLDSTKEQGSDSKSDRSEHYQPASRANLAEFSDLYLQSANSEALLTEYDQQRARYLQEYGDKVASSSITNGELEVDYDLQGRLYLKHSAETIQFFRSPTSRGIPALEITGYQALTPYQVVPTDMLFVPDLESVLNSTHCDLDPEFDLDLTEIQPELLASNAILGFNQEQLSLAEQQQVFARSLQGADYLEQVKHDLFAEDSLYKVAGTAAQGRIVTDAEYLVLSNYYEHFIQQATKQLVAQPSPSQKAALTYQAWLQESPLATLQSLLAQLEAEPETADEITGQFALKRKILNFWLGVFSGDLFDLANRLGLSQASIQELEKKFGESYYLNGDLPLVTDLVFACWQLAVLDRLERYQQASASLALLNPTGSASAEQADALRWLQQQIQLLQQRLAESTLFNTESLQVLLTQPQTELLAKLQQVLANKFNATEIQDKLVAFKKSLEAAWLAATTKLEANAQVLAQQLACLLARLVALGQKLASELEQEANLDLADLLADAEFKLTCLFADLSQKA